MSSRLKVFSKGMSNKSCRGGECADLAFQAQVSFTKMACKTLPLHERSTFPPTTLYSDISTQLVDTMASEMRGGGCSCDLLTANRQTLGLPLTGHRYCIAHADSTKPLAVDAPHSSSKLLRETIVTVRDQTQRLS